MKQAGGQTKKYIPNKAHAKNA